MSPEQIAGWLKRHHPDDPELQVSHETIYRTLFIQSRGALKRELTEHLRTRRQVRQPGNRNRARGTGEGQLIDVVSISQRPAEVKDRAVPGHWEGDLILGKKMTAIGTLVERSSRFVLLFRLDGIKSNIVWGADLAISANTAGCRCGPRGEGPPSSAPPSRHGAAARSGFER